MPRARSSLRSGPRFGGTGLRPSHSSSGRWAGSCESRASRMVVPVRGRPTTKNGRRISCSDTSGCRSSSLRIRIWVRIRRSVSCWATIRPRKLRRASRSKEAVRARSPSRNSSRSAGKSGCRRSARSTRYDSSRFTNPSRGRPSRFAQRTRAGGPLFGPCQVATASPRGPVVMLSPRARARSLPSLRRSGQSEVGDVPPNRALRVDLGRSWLMCQSRNSARVSCGAHCADHGLAWV
jgi:hypothetical protein